MWERKEIMSKKSRSCDSWKRKYDVISEEKQEGGNGFVYFVRKDGEEDALKQLKEKYIRSDKEKRKRFIVEIQTVKRVSGYITGILPIFDDSPSEYWYVMPRAQPIMNKIKQDLCDINKITEFVLELSDSLVQLHDKRIFHRDIKPSNIYFYKERACLSDFGLVDCSEQDERFTKSDKGLGAIFTIAPEMKRNPKVADGGKADVFSLAKTFWMFLTGDERGFDGPYDRVDNTQALSKHEQYKNIHLVELEELLRDATDNAPEHRPNMKEFHERLVEWRRIQKDDVKSQDSEWNFLSHLLFGQNIASSAIWAGAETIMNVLNELARLPVFNHMFLPTNGGMDFFQAELAGEKGCLYLYTDLFQCYVVKPKALYFEGFGIDYRWNYFMLELEELEPILTTDKDQLSEYLVEDTPGHYVSAQNAPYKVYDYDSGEKLPEGFRVVMRYLRGKFLITEKYGPYNGITGVYDARHNMCETWKFREYISKLLTVTNAVKQLGIEEDQVLHQFNANPFTPPMENLPSTSRKTMKEYIEKSVKKWDFSGGLRMDEPCGKISVIFQLNEYKLCRDGFFHQNPTPSDVYHLFCRSRMEELHTYMLDYIRHHYGRTEYDMKDFTDPYIEVHIDYRENPTHLFDEEEIRVLMKEADDRKNNVLVIDEEGYAHILTDLRQECWYPVHQEAWFAGNVYVGKYSELLDVKRSYENLLYGWLEYLKNRTPVFADEQLSYGRLTVLECLDEIRSFYKESP